MKHLRIGIFLCLTAVALIPNLVLLAICILLYYLFPRTQRLRGKLNVFCCWYLFRFYTKVVAPLAGIRHTIVGVAPPGQYIIVCNHHSSWELIWIFATVRKMLPLTKDSLIFNALGCMYIDRSQPRAAIVETLAKSTEALNDGYSILTFPEGTRSPGGVIRRFQTGAWRIAQKTGIPILPVSHNSGHLFTRNGVRRFGTFRSVIGQPVKVDADTNLTASIQSVRQWMAEQNELQQVDAAQTPS